MNVYEGLWNPQGLYFESLLFKGGGERSETEDCSCLYPDLKQSPVTAIQPRHPLYKEGLRNNFRCKKQTFAIRISEQDISSIPHAIKGLRHAPLPPDRSDNAAGIFFVSTLPPSFDFRTRFPIEKTVILSLFICPKSHMTGFDGRKTSYVPRGIFKDKLLQ